MNPHDRYDSLLEWAAGKYGIDAGLLKRQMLAESDADPTALSPVGAAGLMQFMPATWRDIAPDDDKYNPEHSILAGAKYMCQLLKMFDHDYAKALAAYNWGPGNVRGAVKRLGGCWRTALPTETTRYLVKILTGHTTGNPT